MKLYWNVGRNKQSPEGIYAKAFGARVGYWPCVRSPFVQVSFWIWRVSVWTNEPGNPEALK